MIYLQKHFFSLPDIAQSVGLFREHLLKNISLNSRKINKPLVLYGAGNLGRMAKEYLDLIDLRFDAVIDKNAQTIKNDAFWQGIAIYTPQEAPQNLKENGLIAISIVTTPYVHLQNQLGADGWVDICPFYDVAESYRDRHPLSNGWFANSFGAKDVVKIEEVLMTLADDVSRAHYLQFLAWRRMREEWIFDGAPVDVDNRFFIPEITLGLGEKSTFADVGAHSGTVTQAFLQRVQGNFEKIYAIEPDERNLVELRAAVLGYPKAVSEKVEIIPKALSSTGGQRQFYSGLGYASQYSDLGSELVSTMKLDELNICPTLMKFHLEGAELDVLEGSLDTINRARPALAITSYHNDLGIWKLPLWLKNNCSNYEIFMRMHGWCGTGAVLYAIQK